MRKIFWSGETFFDKSKPSESLHRWHRCGAHQHAGLRRRASPPRRARAPPGLLVWRRERREEKDSDSHFYFNSSTGCFYAGWRATVVRPLRVIRPSRPARRKRGSLGEYRELAGRVCQHHHPRFWTPHHDRTHKRYDLFFLQVPSDL